MAITNPNTAHVGSGSPTTLAIPASTIGNLGIFSCSYDNAGTAPAPTGGGTWARIGTVQLDGGHNQDQTWFWTIFTSSITSISIAGGGAPVAAASTYAEFASSTGWNASPLDTSDTTHAVFSSTTSANAEVSTNITPAAAGELIVSAISDSNGTAPTFTAGTGFALAVAEPGAAGANGGGAIEWKTGAAGSQNATWTMDKTGDAGFVQIAAFKPVAAAASSFLPAAARLQFT